MLRLANGEAVDFFADGVDMGIVWAAHHAVICPPGQNYDVEQRDSGLYHRLVVRPLRI